MDEHKIDQIKIIFNDIFKKNINNEERFCQNDDLLEGINITQYLKYLDLKMRMGKFYEKLFCYLCDFYHPQKGFDLVCDKRKIAIELKTSVRSDNFDSKNNKFRKLNTFKKNNPDWNVFYICLNDIALNREGCDYKHEMGFRFISGYKAWRYFCNLNNANINVEELKEFLRNLVKQYF